MTPGHEIVGTVDALGPGSTRFALGERVGVAWLARTDGTCRWCRHGRENLCEKPAFTGWGLDGGYAEYCLANGAFAYRLPDQIPDEGRTHPKPSPISNTEISAVPWFCTPDALPLLEF